ncbi:hypothetical protein NUW54_g14538 [Trametes sanguinea]|uniref:Uncharacterized protein n=1 Tax=Trametes sanguinea TaxID=158606 RepID=A0ACC1MCM1_9APHY|nr:hypothetical protein NUW54_g14538 [Trametes sanguinea]
MRHPAIRTFVQQFAKEPDHAVSSLMNKAGPRDDVALGQLLFRAVDLDRARLGEFLARRSSKTALKAYVDSFGLTGLRIDKALRVFLQIASILFLAGLLILLWTLHPIVAGLASALVGALLVFTVVTIVAPAFSEDCAYRSPQSLDVCILKQGLSAALFALHDALEESACFNVSPVQGSPMLALAASVLENRLP